jgi:hypothetical protein
LTITGAANVMIDGLDTAKLATRTLTVNASAMTGDLKLGVATASDASSSGTYATRTDKDLSVTSGSGNDQIVTYTTLAGDITTNAGNDAVRVGNATTAAASLDVEGVSTITTGEGNDSVVAKDLLVTATDKDEASNTNFDDLTAATINTGAGNDSVTVGALTNASDWDNITITDSNVNDQQFVRGASIDTGAGTDTVSFTTIAEGASISTGDDVDTVTVSLTAANGTILAGDTDADVVSVVTATNADTGDTNNPASATYTNEVSSLGIADRLGAVVDTGSADDTITFTDASSLDVNATTLRDVGASNTIVARDALLAGGTGTDTLNITTLDAVTVTTATSMDDQDGTLTGIQTDINANVTGVETLNLTVANQIINSGITNTAATVVTTAAASSTSVGSIAVTFNARYDLGDVVTVTIGSTVFSHTVLNGATTGADVAAAFKLQFDTSNAAVTADDDYSSTTLTGATLTIATDANVTGTGDGDNAITVAAGVTTNAIRPYLAGNDNSDADGAFTADVLRFDADLTAINMTSQEQILETGPATEYYVPGTATSFTLNNLRESVTTLTLSAHEATGVNTSTGALRDDTLLSIDSATAVVTTNSAAKDVDLTMTWDASSETNDAAAISIGAPAGALSGSFDVLFKMSGPAATDTTDDTTVTTDDDTDQLENFTVNVTDGNSHSFDFASTGAYSGFGDANWGANATNGTNAAVTSLTVNTGGAAVQVDHVGTDRIAFNNAAGTGVTAANVTLRVNQANNFTITTGSGTDIVDMRADDVRSYDTATTGGADNINLGTGRDTLIISASDSLGKNNNIGVNTGVVGTSSTIIDDDVFATVLSAERILVDTTGNGANMITLDEQAGPAGVDTIVLLGAGNQETSIVIGNNFVVPTGTDNSNGQATGATSALVINASTHTGDTTLNIENKDDDSDIAVVNMDVRANATSGAEINFVGTGSLNSVVQVTLTTTATATSTNNVITSSATGTTDGSVDINVLASATNEIDKIILLEGAVDADTTTVAGINAIEGSDTITIEDDWTGAAFELDASALLNTDLVAFNSTTADATGSTGGATITVERADTAALTIRGTQNSDTITTGRAADVVYGNNGNDTVVGDEVTNNAELEVVSLTGSYDAGDVITIVHGGSTMTLTLTAAKTAAEIVTAIVAQDLAGLSADATAGDGITAAGFFAAASAGNGTNNVRLTGAEAGTDYTVTATTTNAATVQTITPTDLETGETLRISVGGVTYDRVFGTDVATTLGAFVTAHATAINAATGGTLAATATTLTITGTGLAATAAFGQIIALDGGDVALSLNAISTQANPTIATETLARSVIGGADTINGGSGDDNITGLVGADVLDGGDGSDTVNYQLSLAAVNVNLATNVVSGGDAQGDVISNFENITGTVYADTLTGSSAANTVDGGIGNDTISTADGADAITAGTGADSINGGNGIDIITLTSDSDADRITSDATVVANADSIVGFVSGTDKFQYTGTLQNALGTNSDGIAGTDVITATTFANGLADANSTAGVVFIATTALTNGSGTQGTAMTALLGATTAATIASTYATFEAALLASGGALNGTITGLDSVLITTDSALLVLDNGTGSVVLRITNSVITDADTLTAAEIELVGVFSNAAQLVAGDFI